MKLKLKWKITFIIILIVTSMILYMTFIGNIGIREKEYKIINNNIPIYGFKVVQFSDLYYGKNMNENKLKELINLINKSKPDIVIFSGDLVDSETNFNNVYEVLNKYLKDIKSTYGNYYVKGEMDIDKTFDSLMEESNFNKLDNTYDLIQTNNGNILITGFNVDSNLNKEVLDIDSNYKILVSHYPDSTKDYIDNFSLVLCSHSLNGQIRLPSFNGLFKFTNSKIYSEPHYKINNTDLYITGGFGNKILNLRLFNTPSFNLYRIVNES